MCAKSKKSATPQKIVKYKNKTRMLAKSYKSPVVEQNRKIALINRQKAIAEEFLFFKRKLWRLFVRSKKQAVYKKKKKINFKKFVFDMVLRNQLNIANFDIMQDPLTTIKFQVKKKKGRLTGADYKNQPPAEFQEYVWKKRFPKVADIIRRKHVFFKKKKRASYSLYFMRFKRFANRYVRTKRKFRRRIKVRDIMEVKTTDYTTLQFVFYFLRREEELLNEIRKTALARTQVLFKQQNSPPGFTHYFMALKILRKKEILKFFRYKSVIVPFLRKRYNIFINDGYGIYKRYKRMRALKNLVIAIKKETIFSRSDMYSQFLIIQKGFRFVFSDFNNKQLFFRFLQAKKSLTNQFLKFCRSLLLMLPSFLVYNHLIPIHFFAKQFIRYGFIAINGRRCTNINYMVKVGDIIEIDKLYFILIFIQDDLYQLYKKFAKKRLRHLSGFLYNYRLLIIFFYNEFSLTANNFFRLNDFELKHLRVSLYDRLFININKFLIR